MRYRSFLDSVPATSKPATSKLPPTLQAYLVSDEEGKPKREISTTLALNYAKKAYECTLRFNIDYNFTLTHLRVGDKVFNMNYEALLPGNNLTISIPVHDIY